MGLRCRYSSVLSEIDVMFMVSENVEILKNKTENGKWKRQILIISPKKITKRLKNRNNFLNIILAQL